MLQIVWFKRDLHVEDNEGSPAQLNTETSCRCISSNRSYGSRCFIVPSAAGATRETEGIDKLAATVLLAELGDISRFESPKQLMAYLGLVPSEHSTGSRRRQVAITLTGNGHAWRMLVESAWSCRFPARQTMHLKRKASMASPEAKAIAWRAQKRLCGKYRQLSQAGKNIKLVCVAIARELVGFIWDIVRHEMPRLAPQRSAVAG